MTVYILGLVLQIANRSMHDHLLIISVDLGQRTVQAVLKREDRKIIKEIKTRKQADTILQFLKGTHANVGRF
jgi:predicted class III extradiol MEMO1 family dioxygenase